MASSQTVLESKGKDDSCQEELVIIDEVAGESISNEIIIDNTLSDDCHSNSGEIAWEIDEEGSEEEVTILTETKPLSDVAVEIPRYNAKFTGYLTEKEYSMETGAHIKNDCVPKRTCFNCLGNHSINECKEKKDYQAIARNKKMILGKKPSSVRYHEDVENKYSSFNVGEFSENLRKALGLRDFEAPDFIYRMRILGYPPGWLKEAEVQRSDVNLFDGTGKPMCHPDEEEGETDVCLIKYQPEKLISFPGFNVPFSDNIQDQCRQLNYPRMQDHHSRESFLKFMRRNRASKYKRKKLKDSEIPQSTESVKMSGDMDLDNTESDSKIEFNPPLPEEISKPPEPPPLPASPPEEKEDGEISEDSNDLKESHVTAKSPLSMTENSTPTSGKRKTVDSEDSCESSSAATLTSLPKRHHRSSSKGFMMGVHIPESITPYDSLPDSSKWNVNVSDHLLFVNLPDALGTWQKMRGIVKSVQNTLEKLRADDDDDD